MNFNVTTSFDTEIEQLKAKLAELETQKHRLATCANKIVEQVGECVIEMKEAGVSDGVLSDWACVIYKEITGEDTPIAEDYGNNKTLEINRLLGIIQTNESAIDQVRNTWEEKENRWYEERKELEAKLNNALQKVTNLTAASLRVSDELNISKKTILELTTANQKLTEEILELRGESPRTDELFKIDLLKKVSDLTIERDTALEQFKAERRCNAQMKNEITELSNRCEKLEEEIEKLKLGNSEPVDDLVVEGYKKTITSLTIANQELSEKLNKLRTELPQPQEETAPKIEQETEDPRQNPEFLEATKNQEIIAEFLKKLDRTTRVDRLIWRKIRELPFNPETMRELGLQINPKSKIHKYLLEQMPVMCAKYIEETGDSSDLDWLPEHFVEQVEYLLKMEASGSASDESTGEFAE